MRKVNPGYSKMPLFLALGLMIGIGVWGIYIELLIKNKQTETASTFEKKKLCADQINRKKKDLDKDVESMSSSGILMQYSIKGCYSKKYKTCVARIDKDMSLAYSDEGRAIVDSGTPYQYEMIDLLNGDDQMQNYYSKTIEHKELTVMGWSFGDFLRALYTVECLDGQDLSEGLGKFEWEKFSQTLKDKGISGPLYDAMMNK